MPQIGRGELPLVEGLPRRFEYRAPPVDLPLAHCRSVSLGAIPAMNCRTHRPETYIRLPFIFESPHPQGLIPTSSLLVHVRAMLFDDLQPHSNYPRDVDSRALLYDLEKDTFTGFLLGSILYGTSEPFTSTRPLIDVPVVSLSVIGALVVVFFRCLATLLDPAYRRGEGIKWGLVTYTLVMFSFVTVYTGITLHIQSISFIDEREFTYRGLKFGPLGYQSTIRRTVLGMLTTVMFVLNYWLADGLLVSPLFDPVSACSGPWCRPL